MYFQHWYSNIKAAMKVEFPKQFPIGCYWCLGSGFKPIALWMQRTFFDLQPSNGTGGVLILVKIHKKVKNINTKQKLSKI